MSRLMRLEASEAVESIGLPCHTAVALADTDGPEAVRRVQSEAAVQSAVLAPYQEGHVLLTPPAQARVRGLPLLAGTCRVLNGDIIECGAATWRYLTHDFLDPERIEPLWLPGGNAGGPILCAACMDDAQPLQAGDPVVYCPSCRWAFHPECLQNPELVACPVCSCTLCRTDHERESTMLKAREGWVVS